MSRGLVASQRKSVSAFSARAIRHRRQRAIRHAIMEAMEPRQLLSAGDLDTSFAGGLAVANFNGASTGTSIDAHTTYVLNDGKVLVAGIVSTDVGQLWAVARLNVDGSLDTTFGPQGPQGHPGWALATVQTDTGYSDDVDGVAVDKSGGIIVVGNTFRPDDTGGDFDVALVRFEADGTLDSGVTGEDSSPGDSFGTAGIVTTPIDVAGYRAYARAVGIQNDGSIVVAGDTNGSSTGYVVTRYTPAGVLDTSFGGTSLVSAPGWNSAAFPNSYVDDVHSMAIADDGSIIVAGDTVGASSMPMYGLVKFGPKGALDGSFGHNGFASFKPLEGPSSLSVGSTIGSIAIDAKDNIVAGGTVFDASYNMQPLALRFTSAGALDGSFGSGGVQTASLPAAYIYGGSFNDVLIESDGKILAAGTASGANQAALVARFTTGGALDTDFAGGVIFAGVPSDYQPAGAALQGTQGLLIGGSMGVVLHPDILPKLTQTSFVVSRYDLGIAPTGGGPVTVSISGPAGGDEGSALPFQATATGGDGGGSGPVYEFDQSQRRAEIPIGTTTATSAPIGDVSFTWTINGVVAGAGPAFTFIPPESGTYTVAASAGDSSDSMEVVIANVAPSGVAIAGPDAGSEGQSMSFSGSAIDPGGPADLTYTWTVDKDGQPFATASGPDWQLPAAAPGTYALTLTVTDRDNASDTAYATVTVANLPPVVSATGFSSVDEGATYSIDLSATDPGADGVSSYSIDWGDGNIESLAGSATTASHVYHDGGDFNIQATATDGSGGTSDPAQLSVTVNDILPTAEAGAPENVAEGAIVQLSGSGTTAACDTIVSYAWDFDYNGVSFTSDATGPATSHQYAPGSHTAALRVTDSDGDSAISTTTITVNNVAPFNLAIAGPDGGVENATGSLSFIGSATDPGGDTDVSYAWSITRDGSRFDSDGASYQLSSAVPGTYLITLIASDRNGASASLTKKLVITNKPPTVLLTGASAVTEGDTFNLTLNATDPGSDGIASYSIDWGDGNIESLAGSATTASHVYHDGGDFNIQATATDGSGGTSDPAQLSVTVNDILPTAEAGSSQNVGEGSAVQLSGSGTTGPGDSLVYAWDFDYIGGVFTADATGPSAWHQYAPGSHTAALKVTDTDGHSAIDTVLITVNNLAPTVAPVVGPASAIRGFAATFSSSFSDPGQNEAYSLTWNFGDGSTLTTPSAKGPVTVSHVYGVSGSYGVTLTVDDGNGGIKTSAAATVVVQSAGIVNGDLLIGGLANVANAITVSPASGGALSVYDNISIGTFNPTGAIIIRGGDAGNAILVAGSITRNTLIFGGAGADVMRGGSGGNVLVGGDGSDLLVGGRGRNLLIGGDGSDILTGSSGDDILIAGSTRYDNDPAALMAIMAEWSRTDHTYAQRVANLSSPATASPDRRNGNYFLCADSPNPGDVTVYDDNSLDIVIGGSGKDWFLCNKDSGVPDLLLGLRAGDFVTDIDPMIST